jgi:hypothetical protein
LALHGLFKKKKKKKKLYDINKHTRTHTHTHNKPSDELDIVNLIPNIKLGKFDPTDEDETNPPPPLTNIIAFELESFDRIVTHISDNSIFDEIVVVVIIAKSYFPFVGFNLFIPSPKYLIT